MSELSDYMRTGFQSAANTIGKRSLKINSGAAVDAVIAERSHIREYQNQGFDAESSLSIVVDSVIFNTAYPLSARSYFGKSCTLDLELWIIGNIRNGDTFTTIDLASRGETK